MLVFKIYNESNLSPRIQFWRKIEKDKKFLKNFLKNID